MHKRGKRRALPGKRLRQCIGSREVTFARLTCRDGGLLRILGGFRGVIGGGDLFRRHRQARHRRRRARVEGSTQELRHRVARTVSEGTIKGHVGQRPVAGLPGHEGDLPRALGDGRECHVGKLPPTGHP